MANTGVRPVFGGGGCLSSSTRRLEPFFISASSSSSSFLGSSSMVSFEDVCGGGKRLGRQFFCTYDQDENGDDDYDEFLHQPGKKRRLTNEQVQFLEKSFETDNKLEPERKVQLAKELGLQPRQVAIWFQNRRARWKTKQMEKDFDTLQASYDNLKFDYESLLKEKEKLKDEVDKLTNKLQQKEQDQRVTPEPLNLLNQSKTVNQETVVESTSETEEQHLSNSAKSDVIDSDSPHFVEAGHSSPFAEPGGDTSYAFEADQSDISQDDEDYLKCSLLPSAHAFPKIEDVDPPAGSCHFDLSGDDHASLLWPYWDISLKMPSSLHM